MNEVKLTTKALNRLQDLNISENDILLSSPIDLSFDGNYIKGYIAVTKDKLGVLTMTLPAGTINYFRGADRGDDLIDEEPGDYEIAVYELDKLAHIRLDSFIGSNVLCGEYSGEFINIAAFTNRYQQEMNVLFRKLKTYLHGGELTAAEEKVEKDEEDTELEEQKKSKRSIFGRTLKYFLRYKTQVALLFLTYLISGAVNIAWPYLTGKVLFDHIIAKDDDFLGRFGLAGQFITALLIVAIVMVLARLIQSLSNYLQIFVMARVASRMSHDIRTDVFDAMSKLSLNFFVNKQTGGLMTRVLSDSDRVREFFIDGLPMIFVHSITIIVTFTVMYRLNWKMALIACILLPLLVFMTVKLRPGLWTLSGKRHRAEKAVTGRANDNLTGARVVKAFGQQDNEIRRFEHPSDNLREAEINIVKLRNRFAILYNMVQEVSSIWIWLIGVFFVLKTHEIELGVLITFVGYVAQLNGPMNFFSWVFRMWSDSINSGRTR